MQVAGKNASCKSALRGPQHPIINCTNLNDPFLNSCRGSSYETCLWDIYFTVCWGHECKTDGMGKNATKCVTCGIFKHESMSLKTLLSSQPVPYGTI